MADGECAIVRAETRLVRIPVDPPRGDAMQQFNALELPIVELWDRANRRGVGFGYTIGTGGTAVLALLQDELIPRLIGQDARSIISVMTDLTKAIHALTPGCISSTALRRSTWRFGISPAIAARRRFIYCSEERTTACRSTTHTSAG